MPPNYGYDLPPHPVTVKTVPLATLKVAPEAQRSQLNKGRVRKMADNWMVEAAGTLVACEDPQTGELFLVDGWHRAEAGKLAGEKSMRVEVHKDLERRHWSQLFLIKNGESQKVNPIDNYRNGLNAQIPLYVEVQAVLDKHDLTMGGSASDKIAAVSGAVKVVSDFGPPTLDRTLALAEAAWGRTAKTWDGMILSGLAKLVARHGHLVEDDLMARKLSRHTPEWWISRINTMASVGNTQATGTGGRTSAAYALFAQAWNANLRNKSRVIQMHEMAA